jgi:hypothetical protein
MQTPERHALRCVNEFESGVVRGYSYLKRAQQDCTDEREYRENCQYIEPQGKVHVTSSLDKAGECSRVQVKF